MVLDTAWTPTAGDRADVVSIRPYFARAVEGADLYAAALAELDRWAAAASAADHLLVEDVTYWFRAREDLWHWVHERLLWQGALEAMDADHGRADVSVPADESALIDVVRALGRPLEIRDFVAADAIAPTAALPSCNASAATAWWSPSILRRVVRRFGATAAQRPSPSERLERERRADENARRTRLLDARLAGIMARPGPRVVVLTLPGSYQRVGRTGSAERLDPNLASVITALTDSGLEPVLIGLGLSRQRDEDWATTEVDERLIPAFYLQTRWAQAEDRDRARSAVEAIWAAIEGLAGTRFVLGSLDLTEPFLAALRDAIARIVEADVQQLARVERIIDEVAPSAFLMTQEGHRTPWLLAARRAGIPTFALQHGILYPGHAGYPNVRHPRTLLPTHTFVFGDYERRVLEGLAYRAGEVSAAGSPRLDLEGARTAPDDPVAERADTRRELGVADGARLLVVSTLHLPFVRRSHLVHMLEACLGGPLPGVHLVFKQHPGERDEGPYRRLLTGLAEAGGYAPPPMTSVKDIDLYRLLRAADGHLGLNSTVLTDAVVSGTTNLIAIVEGHRDLLGYVGAGVAQPIRGVDDLRKFLTDPARPGEAARRAFLDDHFEPGDAGARIAAAIASSVGDHAAVGVAGAAGAR
jgi:hypothetical protein